MTKNICVQTVLFLLLSLMHVVVKGEEIPPVSLDIKKQNEFPKLDTNPRASGKFSISATTTEDTPEGHSRTTVKSKLSAEAASGNTISHAYQLVSANQEVTLADKKKTTVNDGGVLKDHKLILAVDCDGKRPLKKTGFDEAVEKIEKKKKSADQEDLLLAVIKAFVGQDSYGCQSPIFGAFDFTPAYGQTPGFQWSQELPISACKTSKAQLTFKGWNVKQKKSYMVVKAESSCSLGNDKNSGERNFTSTGWFIIRQDGRWFRKVTDSEMKTTSDAGVLTEKLAVDGTTEIE